MRLDSLLLVAILFACLHTSSIRSISTLVVRVRSNEGNAPAEPIEGETITEERTFNFFSFDQGIQAVKSMASKVAKEILKVSLPARLKKRRKPYESLQLHNGDTSQLRSKLWISLLEHPGMPEDLATEVLFRLKDKSVVKLYDALKKANVDKEILCKFEDMLITYSEYHKKSPLDVFCLLKLDSTHSLFTPTVYTPIELKRFKMWIKFSTEKSGQSIVDVCKDFPFAYGLMILDGLRLMKDTQNVKSMEAAVVQSLPRSNSRFDDDIPDAYMYLVLDNGLENLLNHRNIKLFYEFARTAIPKRSNEEALITGSRKFYADRFIGQMLFAWVKEKNAEAEPLLNELFRQWKYDAQKGIIIIDDVAPKKVKKEYDAYVEEMNKREDA